jgi:hypothetical protein
MVNKSCRRSISGGTWIERMGLIKDNIARGASGKKRRDKGSTKDAGEASVVGRG